MPPFRRHGNPEPRNRMPLSSKVSDNAYLPTISSNHNRDSLHLPITVIYRRQDTSPPSFLCTLAHPNLPEEDQFQFAPSSLLSSFHLPHGDCPGPVAQGSFLTSIADHPAWSSTAYLLHRYPCPAPPTARAIRRCRQRLKHKREV